MVAGICASMARTGQFLLWHRHICHQTAPQGYESYQQLLKLYVGVQIRLGHSLLSIFQMTPSAQPVVCMLLSKEDQYIRELLDSNLRTRDHPLPRKCDPRFSLISLNFYSPFSSSMAGFIPMNRTTRPVPNLLLGPSPCTCQWSTIGTPFSSQMRGTYPNVNSWPHACMHGYEPSSTHQLTISFKNKRHQSSLNKVRGMIHLLRVYPNNHDVSMEALGSFKFLPGILKKDRRNLSPWKARAGSRSTLWFLSPNLRAWACPSSPSYSSSACSFMETNDETCLLSSSNDMAGNRALRRSFQSLGDQPKSQILEAPLDTAYRNLRLYPSLVTNAPELFIIPFEGSPPSLSVIREELLEFTTRGSSSLKPPRPLLSIPSLHGSAFTPSISNRVWSACPSWVPSSLPCSRFMPSYLVELTTSPHVYFFRRRLSPGTPPWEDATPLTSMNLRRSSRIIQEVWNGLFPSYHGFNSMSVDRRPIH
ncbi:hypothetical protein VNO77_03812 [Canavalia gladiata]|uniref:Uncharacterized protein n=1 Tax=Canavalia gladiata TaxID=3824 RepID=A0AAN9N1U6_CANGL